MEDFKRVNIIGTSGSGKSTFGKKLAQVLSVPYLQMDQLYWKPNWQEPGDEEFFKKLTASLQSPGWVLDGNYTRTTPIKWKNVQAVVWLDYSFHLVFFRIVKRSLARAITKAELWPGTGNRESLRKLFFSKESMIWWVIKTYGPNKARYEQAMADGQFAHIKFIRLTSQKEADQFLKNVESAAQKHSRYKTG